MRSTVRLVIAVLPVVLLLAGCQKLNVTKSFQLEPGDTKGVIVDAPKKDQKIAVSVKSAAGPVDVYVILIKADTEDLGKLMEDKNAGAVLGSQKQTQDATLEATVPGGSKFAAVVT